MGNRETESNRDKIKRIITYNFNLKKKCDRMRKLTALVFTVVIVLGLIGCTNQPPEAVHTVKGNLKTYYEMSDGTWQYNGYAYKYRLVITGRQPFAIKDSTYIYLSNIEDIPFGKAMMASGLSSHTKDYFSREEAVLIEIY